MLFLQYTYLLRCVYCDCEMRMLELGAVQTKHILAPYTRRGMTPHTLDFILFINFKVPVQRVRIVQIVNANFILFAVQLVRCLQYIQYG